MARERTAIVIGAGFTGLAAAYELARAGWKVQIFEGEGDIGGLSGTFEISPGVKLEKFYHHWFMSDTDMFDFLAELGLKDRIQVLQSPTGVYIGNSVYRLATPRDLLQFYPLPFIDRIRTGLMAARARSICQWEPLESISAAEWIRKMAGQRAYELLWEPLLRGKFGAYAEEVSAVWFWNKVKLRGGSRKGAGGERLVYLEGSFAEALSAVRKFLEQQGAEIFTDSPVSEVIVRDKCARGILTRGREYEADVVLATVPIPVFLDIVAQLPVQYREQCEQIQYLGNVCLVLGLDRSLSDIYWLNVTDASFPFVGVIEHTNLVSFPGQHSPHIAYFSRYLDRSDWMFSATAAELLDYSIPHIKRVFPQFDVSWINVASVWRASYSQPVITKHYSKLIPAQQTPIENLWLCTMAQIYPEDRGTNYAVKYGRAIGRTIALQLA